MAGAITASRARNPRATLEFRPAHSTRRRVELLRGGRVDLAWITLGQPLPGIRQRPVIDLPWVLVVHRLDVGHAVVPMPPRLVLGPDNPVRAIPIHGLKPIVAGWAVRQWNALSPLAAEFADLVAAG